MSQQPKDNPKDRNNGDDGVQAGTDAPDVIDLGALDEALEAEAVSADEHKRVRDERDKLLYAVAESANQRRRLEAEKDQAVQYANQVLIRSLVPIIDNFERALAVDPGTTDAASVLKGMQMVHDQIMAELRKQQVEVIDPRAGDPFDPTRHEALMQRPDTGQAPNTIVQTLTRGYTLHGRTLRPAGVMVAQ